jgi:hypothetical protein
VENTKMITTIKLTGETVAVAMGVSAASARLRGGVVLGLGVAGLGRTGFGATGAGTTGAGNGTGVAGNGTGLSRRWTPVVTPVVVERVERSERPTQAPKAAAAAAEYGYVHAIGAGTQQDQQIHLAEADFPADVTRSMRAFRGLDPWRERT